MFSMEIWMSLLISLIFLTILFYKKSFNYWKTKNVPYFQPRIPFGNIENPLLTKKGHNVICKLFYDKFKGNGRKFGGIFLGTTPVLVPTDPELIKHILVKDFNYFTSHGIHIDENVDPLFNHLFAMNEPQWKPMRVKLTPNFSTAKMKMMFQTMLNVGLELERYVENIVNQETPIDVKELFSSFTIDVIGSSVFGVECNCLKNPEAEFRIMCKRITTPSALFILRRFFINTIPFLKIPIFDADVTNFFMGAVKSVVDNREKSGFRRDDFIQILLDMRDNGLENSFNFNDMVAQAFVFFLAGFESSSTTLTLCLHEISHNQSIQDKLREEINDILEKNGGELTYEALNDMKYMSQVIDETLRKYPPLSIIPRECTIDYIIPGYDVTIEKGTHIWISTLGLHRDPEHYPNPDKFDPERFNDDNRRKRHPFSFIPFGEGPRICIGLRFGITQIKIGLSILLSRFKFVPLENTRYEVYFHPNTVFISPREQILLRAIKI